MSNDKTELYSRYAAPSAPSAPGALFVLLVDEKNSKLLWGVLVSYSTLDNVSEILYSYGLRCGAVYESTTPMILF